jgi:hypothetical protein
MAAKMPVIEMIWTDAKYDDCVAVALKVLESAQRDCPVELRIVLTDVTENGHVCGRNVMHTLTTSIMELHDISNVNITYAHGSVVDEPQRHEEAMWSVYGPGEQDQSEASPTTWSDAREFLDVFPYVDYVIAPFNGFEDVIAAGKSTFLASGYNSTETGVSIEDFKAMPNLTIMNNSSPTIYPPVDGKRQEGGRFKQDDIELWATLNMVSPVLLRLREAALVDSRKFALKYAKKAFAHCKIDFDITEDNILSKECQAHAQSINADDLPNPYWFRSIDQVARGVFDVECTDGQHMALWLSGKNMSRITLVDTGEYFDIQANPGGFANCPVGLTVEVTRTAVITLCQSFMQNLRISTSTPKSNSSGSPTVSPTN